MPECPTACGGDALFGAKKDFILLPKGWVVERSFAWTGRFRRLGGDYERLAQTLAGLHVVAFAILMLKYFVELIT